MFLPVCEKRSNSSQVMPVEVPLSFPQQYSRVLWSSRFRLPHNSTVRPTTFPILSGSTEKLLCRNLVQRHLVLHQSSNCKSKYSDVSGQHVPRRPGGAIDDIEAVSETLERLSASVPIWAPCMYSAGLQSMYIPAGPGARLGIPTECFFRLISSGREVRRL